jgi:RecB family endonuclease NucS
MPSEAQLETLIAGDVTVLGLDVLLIGRQVVTAYGKRIDLLGIDAEGDLHLIELKRDRTPREVVVQALD